MSKEKDFKTIVKDIAGKAEPAINKILTASVLPRNHELVKYQISAGGKRLRPAIAVLACRMMGGELKNVLYPAAALEILHNYTLIVDDIIDHSEFRRSKPTVWKEYGQSMAESLSVSYAASIFDITGKCAKPAECSAVLARALKTVADGEILDILFEQDGREDEAYVVENRYRKILLSDYLEMIYRKTASLVSACCEIGGICANAKDAEIKNLRAFGLNLGLAFQIQDDILDMFGDEKKFGKKIGKDIEERKLGSAVMLFAMEEFSAPDKKAFLNILKNKKISDKEIKEALLLIGKTKAREKAVDLEMKHVKKAKQSLAKLPQNKWNKVLGDLTDYLVDRSV